MKSKFLKLKNILIILILLTSIGVILLQTSEINRIKKEYEFLEKENEFLIDLCIFDNNLD